MADETDQIERALSLGGLGFGAVAAASPDLFLKMYGLRSDDTGRMFARMWGVANIAIGATGLRAESDAEKREHLVLTAALSAGNFASILLAGKDVGGGSKAMGLLTTAGFLAGAAYALSKG